MDGRQRRRFKGTQLHVKIGYGNNKKTRFMMPDGFLKFRVSNVQELELLLMHNKKYAAGEQPSPHPSPLRVLCALHRLPLSLSLSLSLYSCSCIRHAHDQNAKCTRSAHARAILLLSTPCVFGA